MIIPADVYSSCSKSGEYHGNNPEMSKLLHKAVRQKSENAYSIYQQHLANRPVNVSLKFAFILMNALSVT